MQQDKYIFHLYVFSTCFGRDITHHQELQNCTHSYMVMVPREVRRDVVEEIKWRQFSNMVQEDLQTKKTDFKFTSILFPQRHLFGILWEPLPYLNVYSSVTPDDR